MTTTQNIITKSTGGKWTIRTITNFTNHRNSNPFADSRYNTYYFHTKTAATQWVEQRLAAGATITNNILTITK